MLKIISNTGDWDILIDGIEYNFFYSNAKPIEGLILNGYDRQQEEYKIGNTTITATKEDYLHNEQGYRYILIIESESEDDMDITELDQRTLELISKEILNSDEMQDLLDHAEIKEWDLVGSSGKYNDCNWYSITDINGEQYDVYERVEA